MPQNVFDIKAFCESHRISRSFFYKLLEEGQGPRLMKLGRRILISAESAAEWRAEMERRTHAAREGAVDSLRRGDA